MSSQYGELGPTTADICWRVCGTPANFKGFRVLASLLCPYRRRSTEANQTLHDVWPSPGLVHYMYIFGGSCPVTEFCQVQNSLCVQVLHAFFYIGSVTARHSSSGRQRNFAESYKKWNYGTFADSATYIRLGGHHVGNRPTLLLLFKSPENTSSLLPRLRHGSCWRDFVGRTVTFTLQSDTI